ncbi:Alpha/Beta hydrolase protein [Mycena rosella]|uniref:Alpha/Beta hydrolase protein n=1 Tax=Mycena rosella TaxID=1033263 RepID=A0AAD7CH78_MYCRO|nr:Alpha/Beta hydrolase protein [Mycena rosella]
MLPPFLHITALAATVRSAAAAASYSLHVNTASETLYGFIDSSAPTVRQFLGVSFALPPTGPRRWLPPVPTAIVNATSFGLSFPQIPLNDTAPANVYTANGGGQTEFFPRQEFSEDCLTLNVWAPAQPQSAMLPVIVWFYGGGFTQGGADSLYFNAAPWVQRTQAHIVVRANFRTNIFGFPNAAGSAEQNPGLLDQRAALEWVRDNAAAFGGDIARIVAWGESAGAIAVDYLNFAFYKDPIVAGFIMDGATALFPERVKTTDTAQANFAAVAAQLGCGGGAPAAQIDGLRSRVVFANYTARYGAGLLARVPALLGTNQHELNALGAQGRTTYRSATTATSRTSHPPGFTGAYHASELPLIFGMAGQFHGPSTAYENEVSGRLQDLWVAFAQDPEKGLQTAGWKTFGAGKAVFLGDADTPMKEVDVRELDGACAKK